MPGDEERHGRESGWAFILIQLWYKIFIQARVVLME
jgi:hypothetical protein